MVKLGDSIEKNYSEKAITEVSHGVGYSLYEEDSEVDNMIEPTDHIRFLIDDAVEDYQHMMGTVNQAIQSLSMHHTGLGHARHQMEEPDVTPRILLSSQITDLILEKLRTDDII